MSIVLAVRKGKRIVVAADTLSCCGTHKDPPDNAVTTKIRRVGNAIIGITGWSLYENILTDMLQSAKPPRLTTRESIFKFSLTLWNQLKKRYNLVNEQSDDKYTPFGDMDAQFLIVTKKGIFSLASNLTVSEFRKYYAVGGGSDYAFGSLHSLYDAESNPKTIAEKAVQASIHFDAYCGGPIEYLELKM